MKKKIAVIDGQGGGMGRILIERLRESLSDQIEILALGTNALATSAMIKAGADHGASGENAIMINSVKADIITGSLGIISANSFMGELTPAMAAAISASGAVKVLVPMNRCNLMVAGVRESTIQAYVEDAVTIIGGLL
jgi:hypothetical protein